MKKVKRKYVEITLIVLISMCTLININSYEKNNKIQTKEAAASPVSNKVVILDAGHGGEDRRSSKPKWSTRIRY